jgi:hypothetical protein
MNTYKLVNISNKRVIFANICNEKELVGMLILFSQFYLSIFKNEVLFYVCALPTSNEIFQDTKCI